MIKSKAGAGIAAACPRGARHARFHPACRGSSDATNHPGADSRGRGGRDDRRSHACCASWPHDRADGNGVSRVSHTGRRPQARGADVHNGRVETFVLRRLNGGRLSASVSAACLSGASRAATNPLAVPGSRVKRSDARPITTASACTLRMRPTRAVRRGQWFSYAPMQPAKPSTIFKRQFLESARRERVGYLNHVLGSSSGGEIGVASTHRPVRRVARPDDMVAEARDLRRVAISRRTVHCACPQKRMTERQFR
jgi:hypothetical protein